MRIILYILFLTTLTVDYLDKILHVIPYHLELLPEVLSVVAAILIIGQLSKTKNLNLSFKYIVIFSLLGVHMINGILINSTPVAAVVIGLRVYLKYIPFFILPMVYEIDEGQISKLLKFILVICLFQMPMAIFQRFYYARNISGDWVRGTLGTSSILSMLLIGTIAIVWAYYLKRRISIKYLVILLLILFIPTTINETKGTLVLLPIALIVPILIVRKQEGNQRSLLPLILIGTIMFGGFVTVYDTIWGARYDKYGGSVLDFFTSDRIVRYLAPRASEMVQEKEGGPVGRIDKIAAPIKTLSKDPVLLLVGVGVGNATPSPIKSLSSAEYVHYFKENLTGTSTAFLIWELGLIGLLLSMIFLYFVFKDSKRLSERDGLEGALGLGWTAVVVLIFLSLSYKNIIPSNGLMYPFWFLSGFILSKIDRSNKKELVLEKEEIMEKKEPSTPRRIKRHNTKNKNSYIR